MIINYTDIAAESESVTVSLEGLDAGTSAFMTWFKEQASIQTTLSDDYGWCGITTTPTEKDYSEFDFSSAEIVNPWESFNDIGNSLFISVNKNLHSLIGMYPHEVTSSFASSMQKSDKITPSIFLFHNLPYKDIKSNHLEKYNVIKDTLGSDKFNDPAYGISLIRIAKLNIDPGNAIENVESISF